MNNQILDQMQRKQKTGVEVIEKKSFSDGDMDTVAVCAHPESVLGGYHTHDFFEINYVREGNCINLVEDGNESLAKGDLIIFHPGAFHLLYAAKGCKVYNFLIDKNWFLQELKKLPKGDGKAFDFFERAGKENFFKYFVLRGKSNNLIKEKAEKIIELSSSTSPLKYLLKESAFLELLCSIVEGDFEIKLSRLTGEGHYKMINMLSYLANNYSTVTLEKLSEKFFYSKTHICRTFIKNTKKTFNQTLIELRLSNAKAFLEEGLTVEAVARKVGYNSVEYFQRLFKKETGISPGEYKKHAKSGHNS